MKKDENKPKKETNRRSGIWSDGGDFVETVSAAEMKDKMRTFHMKHDADDDEQMNFVCKKCGAKISAHNKDWHAGMCDDCFGKEQFPDM